MDIIELHERVHARIIKAGATERTTDAVMWIVRAALADEQTRVRELEEENQKLRDDLEASAELWIPTGRGRVIEVRYEATTSENFGDWWIEVPWKPLKSGRMENAPTRDAALSRARDIAKED